MVGRMVQLDGLRITVVVSRESVSLCQYLLYRLTCEFSSSRSSRSRNNSRSSSSSSSGGDNNSSNSGLGSDNNCDNSSCSSNSSDRNYISVISPFLHMQSGML